MTTEDIAGIFLFIGVMGLVEPRLLFGIFFGGGAIVLVLMALGLVEPRVYP